MVPFCRPCFVPLFTTIVVHFTFHSRQTPTVPLFSFFCSFPRGLEVHLRYSFVFCVYSSCSAKWSSHSSFVFIHSRLFVRSSSHFCPVFFSYFFHSLFSSFIIFFSLYTAGQLQKQVPFTVRDKDKQQLHIK